MNIKEEQAAAADQLRETLNAYKTGQADAKTLTEATNRLETINRKAERVEEADQQLAALGTKTGRAGQAAPSTLGAHFVKTIGTQVAQAAAHHTKMDISAPLFKTQSDVHTLTGDLAKIAPVQIDTTFTQQGAYPLTIADWLGSGALTERTLTYFVETLGTDQTEGFFKVVGEGELKPQLHFKGYAAVTETLSKIAGFIKISDEMAADADFLVTEINNRLLLELRRYEEKQLLAGTDSVNGIKGLLNRDHVQTMTYKAPETLADAIFKAITQIRITTGIEPDGIVVNPADYQTIRLAKDGNQQYYAGGPFAGAYGQPAYPATPLMWGKQVIVTPAMTAGTVLVGAGKTAATVYRKDGIEVAASSQDQDDFVRNRITIRAEERLALAVRVPAAFCKLTVEPGK